MLAQYQDRGAGGSRSRHADSTMSARCLCLCCPKDSKGPLRRLSEMGRLSTRAEHWRSSEAQGGAGNTRLLSPHPTHHLRHRAPEKAESQGPAGRPHWAFPSFLSAPSSCADTDTGCRKVSIFPFSPTERRAGPTSQQMAPERARQGVCPH